MKRQQKAEKAEQKKAAQEAAKTNGSANISGNSTNRRWTDYDKFTVGINLLDRDERSVNDHVNVSPYLTVDSGVLYYSLDSLIIYILPMSGQL